jgi:aminopeptidase N
MLLKILIGSVVLVNLVLCNEIPQILENKFKSVDEQVLKRKLDDTETYRLPNDSLPLKYDLFLSTRIDEGDFDFGGNVKILIKIVETTSVITLKYRSITIQEANLINNDFTTSSSAALDFSLVSSREFLKVALPRSYQPNEELALEIVYNGTLRGDGAGFYYGYYNNEANERVYYGATQFEVDDARHAMPCYDEPGIRAEIKLTILHGARYTAISNMPVESVITFFPSQITYFKPTPRMQSYLLAFVISDFAFEESDNSTTRVPQRIYATKKLIADGYGNFGARVVGPVLHKFEEDLGVEYPLPKMDHAALSVFNFGAMENFGLITYIESGLLLNPNTAPTSLIARENSIIGLVAHEYAHQWFGNIISPKFWTYTWLNEGFATLYSSYIPQLMYPERDFMLNFVTSNMPLAFAYDTVANGAWSMNHYTEEPASLWNKFGRIGYQKSGCVLRMFMESLTIPTFTKGINYYLTDMYMQAADPDDLHRNLQKAYDEVNSDRINIGNLMGTWENQAGYPIISVRKSGQNLVFSQRRFPQSNGEIYSVPLTFATKSGPDFTRTTPREWLTQATLSVSFDRANFTDGDWIVLNIGRVGYYRVDYDKENWLAISHALESNIEVIHPINRAVLTEEIAISWMQLKTLNAGDIFQYFKYFGCEDHSLVWRLANPLLNELSSRLQGTEMFAYYQRFIISITRPHLMRLGYEGISTDPQSVESLRNIVRNWNSKVFDTDILVHELMKFRQFYMNGDNAVTFNHCDALRLLDYITYHEIVHQVTTNGTVAHRMQYIANLGCSLDESKLHLLLHAAIDATNILGEEERLQIFLNTAASSPISTETLLHFINENHMEIHAV